MDSEDKAAAGCLGASILAVVVANLLWWGFVAWMIYLIVTHFTK